ncbi:hypothetical protein ACFLSQ_08155, partial [Bacteroidota bacterium]
LKNGRVVNILNGNCPIAFFENNENLISGGKGKMLISNIISGKTTIQYPANFILKSQFNNINFNYENYQLPFYFSKKEGILGFGSIGNYYGYYDKIEDGLYDLYETGNLEFINLSNGNYLGGTSFSSFAFYNSNSLVLPVTEDNGYYFMMLLNLSNLNADEYKMNYPNQMIASDIKFNFDGSKFLAGRSCWVMLYELWDLKNLMRYHCGYDSEKLKDEFPLYNHCDEKEIEDSLIYYQNKDCRKTTIAGESIAYIEDKLIIYDKEKNIKIKFFHNIIENINIFDLYSSGF